VRSKLLTSLVSARTGGRAQQTMRLPAMKTDNHHTERMFLVQVPDADAVDFDLIV